MKQRKCIGVIISRPCYDYQSNLLSGIFERAFEADLNVAVFSTSDSESFSENTVYPQRIFELPDAENMCGMIYAQDTIYGMDTQSLTERIRGISEKMRVVVVDTEIEGFRCIVSSDDKAIKKMTSHLTDEHGCKSIAFMTGPKGHPHSEKRLASFREEMTAHGLEVDESLIFYGDFWYDAGEGVVEALLERESLPDAMICASDRMAYSVYKAFKEKGRGIPEDIIIAAYAEKNPRYEFFTSCGKNTKQLGRMAVDALLDDNAEPTVDIMDESTELLPAFTCGCVAKNMVQQNDYIADSITEFDGFFSINNDMKDKLVKTVDFTDFFWVMSWFTHFLGDITHFSISLSKGWDALDVGRKRQYDRKMPMNLVYQRNCFESGEDERTVDFERSFDISEIHPILKHETTKPQGFFFHPFVSDESCFGYAALSYGDKLRTVDNTFLFWLKDVLFCLDSQKRLFAAKRLYDRMERYAVTDNMTGLINRNGFEDRSEELLANARKTGRNVAVVMADLNSLKYINDTYGHEHGDNAIRTAAKAISTIRLSGTEHEENFRMGGDEFLKVAVGNFTEEEAGEMHAKIRDYLESVNRSACNDYPVILSVGYCVRPASEAEDIGEMVTEADINMYADKLREKKRTGIDAARGEN